jgi:hypothetical protein
MRSSIARPVAAQQKAREIFSNGSFPSFRLAALRTLFPWAKDSIRFD